MRREVPPPPEVLAAVLHAASALERVVLVGGQALAFWMARAGVCATGSTLAVTRDIDFLSASPVDIAAVRAFANALGGEVLLPHERNLTALVGQAVRAVDAEHVWNIDVVFKVFGNVAPRVIEAAPRVRLDDGAELLVMHPLHVLKSRLDNLYALREKQTPQGEAQLRYAIEVVRRLMPMVLRDLGESGVRVWIRAVARLARSDAGKKIATRRGIHVVDAIVPEATQCANFHRHHWPRLQKLRFEAQICGSAVSHGLGVA